MTKEFASYLEGFYKPCILCYLFPHLKVPFQSNQIRMNNSRFLNSMRDSEKWRKPILSFKFSLVRSLNLTFCPHLLTKQIWILSLKNYRMHKAQVLIIQT